MSFTHWALHFVRNANQFNHIDIAGEARLPADVLAVVASSVQQFQRGENSEGRHLMDRAHEMGDTTYADALRVFIREEQEHARILGMWLQHQGIPLVREDVVDGIFRLLRRLGGLEWSVRVLITAELIAAVYYRALRDATPSAALAAICQQILLDEEQHITFQSSAIRAMDRQRSAVARFVRHNLHRLLIVAAVGVVWLQHGRVMRRSAWSFTTFAAACWQEWRRADAIMHGRLAAVPSRSALPRPFPVP